MPHFIENINAAAAAWAPTVFAVLWQSTLLAALVAAACWALRRHSPALRYGILLLFAAKLLVMPAWSVGIAWPQWMSPAPAPPQSVHEAASFVPPQPATPPTPANEAASFVPPPPLTPQSQLPVAPTPTWQSWLLMLWFAVMIGEIARTMWQFRRLRKLLAATHPAPPDVVNLVADCARTLKLKVAPPAREIAGEGSPMVCGLFRPVLVLPAATLAAFDAPALRQIILHELAHVRRHDLWTIWIIHAARTMYWFHPVAHWIAYRAGLERELACDQLAITHSGATAGAYARTLVRAAPVHEAASFVPSSSPVNEAASFVSPPAPIRNPVQ